MKFVLVFLLAGLFAPATAFAVAGDMASDVKGAMSVVWSSGDEDELPDPLNPPPGETHPE